MKSKVIIRLFVISILFSLFFAFQVSAKDKIIKVLSNPGNIILPIEIGNAQISCTEEPSEDIHFTVKNMSGKAIAGIDFCLNANDYRIVKLSSGRQAMEDRGILGTLMCWGNCSGRKPIPVKTMKPDQSLKLTLSLPYDIATWDRVKEHGFTLNLDRICYADGSEKDFGWFPSKDNDFGYYRLQVENGKLKDVPLDVNEELKIYSEMKVVKLVNGPNNVDINGDGIEDLVFVARRGNYNAHDYSKFTFFIHPAPGKDLYLKEWNLVPFFNSASLKDVQESESLSTYEGADCILRDIRIIVPENSKGKPVVVVIGERKMGSSFADKEFVHFTEYQLKFNKDGLPGYPPYRFEAIRTVQSKAMYCDVNKAFDEELGLGLN